MSLTMRYSKIVLLACSLPLLSWAQTAPKIDAKAAQELSEKHFCSGCHQMDMKVVGPGLKEIAAKYRSDKDAAAKLVDKVKKGGVGVWGPIPMPPNEAVKDEDVKLMVAWILSL